MKLVLLASFLLFETFSAIEIDEYSPAQEIVVGDPLILSSHITTGLIENSDWKTCTWSRDSDQAKCEYTYKQKIDGWIVDENCTHELSNSKFFGSSPTYEENKLCGIIIPEASSLDNGTWKCRIYGCQRSGCAAEKSSLQFDDAFIKVKVEPTQSSTIETTKSSAIPAVRFSAVPSIICSSIICLFATRKG